MYKLACFEVQEGKFLVFMSQRHLKFCVFEKKCLEGRAVNKMGEYQDLFNKNFKSIVSPVLFWQLFKKCLLCLSKLHEPW